MHRRGYDVTSTDIADYLVRRGPGVDFLSHAEAAPDGCRAIVTSPPMARPGRSKAKRSPPWRCLASCVTRYA